MSDESSPLYYLTTGVKAGFPNAIIGQEDYGQTTYIRRGLKVALVETADISENSLPDILAWFHEPDADKTEVRLFTQKRVVGDA